MRSKRTTSCSSSSHFSPFPSFLHMLSLVLDKEAQLAQSASERRRRISPSLCMIAFITLLAASSLLYSQVGGTTTIEQSLDDAKVYLARLAKHYDLRPSSPHTYTTKSSTQGVRPSTIMRISASEPDLMLRIPVESINLSDSVCCDILHHRVFVHACFKGASRSDIPIPTALVGD